MFQMTQTVQLLTAQGEAILPQAVGAPTQTSALATQLIATQPVTNITNQQVAEVLFNIATVLTMQQDNPYRIAAYQNAARGMMGLREPVAEIIARGERLELPGLGDRLRRKIAELVTTGHMTFYDDLCEESLPEDARELMSVAHVGPRTALRLTGYLNIHTVADLQEAARNHRLREQYGFGPRSEQRLADGAQAVLLARQSVGEADRETSPSPVSNEISPTQPAQASTMVSAPSMSAITPAQMVA